MTKLKIGLVLLCLGGLFGSCSKNDEETIAPAPRGRLELDLFEDLGDLGARYVYEGWLTVDGNQVSTGKFTATKKEQNFSVLQSDLDAATAFTITIEPQEDKDPDNPSPTRLLYGTFEGNTARLDVYRVLGDFSSAVNVSGTFILQAPTSETPLDDAKSGVWFETMTGMPGLRLPELGNGWVYQGWVAFENTSRGSLVLSTGTFSRMDEGDSDFYYSGPHKGPSFPGEDFLKEPNFLDLFVEFPLSIPGNRVFITIEPAVDLESTIPFFLSPLTAIAGDDTYTLNTMDFVKSTFPEGRIVKN